MYGVTRTWNNRDEAKRLRLLRINNRTWTRRIQWLEGDRDVKLKFDEDTRYSEVCVPPAFAQTIWDRFVSGQSAEDAVSIYGLRVWCPSRKLSRQIAETNKR